MFSSEDDNEYMDELNNKAQKFQRLLFFHDIEKYPDGVMAVTVDEFIEIFGVPTDEEFGIITKCLLNDFKRHDINNPKFIRKIQDKWSIDWMECILEWNSDMEKYENCVKIRDFVNSYKEIAIKETSNKKYNIEII